VILHREGLALVHNGFINRTENPSVDENERAEPHEPVQFFLINQAELRDIQPDLRQEPFYKRLAAAAQLKSLTFQETRNCVECGLRAQDWNNYPAFDSQVFHVIHQYSAGEPDRIVTLCNHLLLQCFVEQLPRITAANAQAMVNKLPGKPLLPQESQSRKLSANPPCEARSFEEPLVEESPPEKSPLVEELLPEKPLVKEPLPEESPPVEEPVSASHLPSDTPPSSREKAKFGSRNVSQVSNRGRGNW
jgi:hypothetical protein